VLLRQSLLQHSRCPNHQRYRRDPRPRCLALSFAFARRLHQQSHDFIAFLGLRRGLLEPKMNVAICANRSTAKMRSPKIGGGKLDRNCALTSWITI